MNMQLINEPKYETVKQILYNRGLELNKIEHYLNLNDNDIFPPEMLGIDNLKAAAALLISHINNNNNALIIVDCDCDGYTSAALLINYLYCLFPTWVVTKLSWIMHDGKQHGLADKMNEIESYDYSLVICPDSSSNDYEYHKILSDKNIDILVLDHHLADEISTNAVIVNNQLSDYPNKQLSGVGVVWQFCRYIDKILDTNFSNDFIDLVALGNCGDMMSLTSFETRYLIFKGFKKDNIHNPFIEYMIDKNNFPLSKTDYKSCYSDLACTNIGAAFFIVPFVNAITRSGTLEEKELIFKSMLNHEAFKMIPEVKRNKLTGKEEYLVLQAVRVIGNVKNRQTRAEEAGLKKLEAMIQENNMLEHKILLFVLEPNEVPSEIRGLIANKFMAKYQRPCIIVTRGEEECCGSGRGYTKTGLENLKGLLEECTGVNWVQGHENAHGISLQTQHLNEFLLDVDNKMKDISTEPVYRVDYFWKTLTDNMGQRIIDIASLNDYWGQDIDRAHVGIRFKINSSNFAVMKSNTLKITLDNGVSLIKFNGTEEDIENFTTTGWIVVEAYCKCAINEWNCNQYPQLIIEDYDIIDSCKYLF